MPTTAPWLTYWNDANVEHVALIVDAQDRGSTANSLLIDLRANGVSKFAVRKDGTVFATAIVANTSLPDDFSCNTLTANIVTVQVSLFAANVSANNLSVNNFSVGAFSANAITANVLTALLTVITSNLTSTGTITANVITANAIVVTTFQTLTVDANVFNGNTVNVRTVNANVFSGNTATVVTVNANTINANVFSGNTVTAASVNANAVNANVFSGNTVTVLTINANAVNGNVFSGNVATFANLTITGTVSVPVSSINANSISGVLSVSRGGTGVSTFGGTNRLLYTTATDTLSSVPSNTSQVLVSNATGFPIWSDTLPAVSGAALTSLNAGNISAGTLAVARGGTGLGTYVVGDLLYASATGTLATRAAVATGSVLASAGVTTAPVWSTAPAFTGTNITGIPETAITNGSLLARVADSETVSGLWAFSNVGTTVFAGTVSATAPNGTALGLEARGRVSDDIGIIRITNNAGTVQQFAIQTNTTASALLILGSTIGYDMRTTSFEPWTASIASLGTASKPWTKTFGGVYCGREISPSALSANTNNWSPTGLSTAYVLRISASGALTITGLDGTGFELGRPLIINNSSAFNITLAHENGSSTDNNRFFFADGLPRVMLPNQIMTFLRNPFFSNRWVLLSSGL